MKTQEEVLQIRSQIEDFITKVAENDPDDKEINAVMRSLNVLEGVAVSRDMLQATKIGAVLTKLSKSTCEKIGLLKTAATKITGQWKEALRKQSSSLSGSREVAQKRPRPDAATDNPDDEPCYQYHIHNEVIRDRALNYLFKSFVAYRDESYDYKKVSQLVYEIEAGLFDAFLVNNPTQKEYTQKLKSIAFNLKDPKNTTFRNKIYKGAIDPLSVAKMESAEMASDEKKLERNNILQESLEACQSDWAVKNILMSKDGKKKGQFKCFKCNSSDTVYYQMQTRSSDEPMTTFVTCLQCNNRWKF